jgi:hypothetical protein
MTENKDKLEDHRKRQIPEIPNPRRKQLPWQVVKQPSEDAPNPDAQPAALYPACVKHYMRMQ